MTADRRSSINVFILSEIRNTLSQRLDPLSCWYGKKISLSPSARSDAIKSFPIKSALKHVTVGFVPPVELLNITGKEPMHYSANGKQAGLQKQVVCHFR